MRLRTLLRSSSAVVLAPLLAGLVVLLLRADGTLHPVPGYGLSVLTAAHSALPYIAAACAGSAAWEGGRLKQGRVFEQAPARGRLGIALPVLAPVWLMGLGGYAVALVMAAVAADGTAPDLSRPPIPAVAALLLLAATLTGYLAGLVLPRLAAGPVALVGAFWVMAFPASWQTPWPRHLVGNPITGCCGVGQAVAPDTLWAAGIFTAAACAAALLTAHRATVGTAVTAVAVLALGTTLAAGFGQRMGYDGTVPRAAAELACDASARPRVCLWPETPGRTAVVAQIRTETGRLGAAGVPVPAALTQDPAGGPDTGVLGRTGELSPEEVTRTTAAALLPAPLGCEQPAREPLLGWLTAVATGEPPSDARVRAVLEQPRAAQSEWFRAGRDSLTDCGRSGVR
ncbi:hypothetical protein [Streptomyces sp. NPDC048603]|uniref:DUF7224 domain-containing protein n=1 Tax=Streptomyces sp. NPDC048603 TaxID=3365577 RepID=UPI00371A2579